MGDLGLSTGDVMNSLGLDSGDPGKVTKAALHLCQPPSSPGGSPVKYDEIKFQFNPSDLNMVRKAGWKSEGQRSSPTGTGMPQYSGNPEPASLRLKFFLDATEKLDDQVWKDVKKLFACVMPTDESVDKGKPSPPWVKFDWGKFQLQGYIADLNVTWKMFKPDGTPIRATCDLTLNEILDKPPFTNPTSGGVTATRTHRVIAGDTLQSVAYANYGRASYYRVLADANGIDDPLRLPIGMVLAIPAESEIAYG